ncbi:hypothetical protein BRADI_5g27053v3 [Brachypodium distachyon]|uniref:KIB1-4 beta-propeller domain-containing protein n=1 Tax=Brachypodium distachyon TaxID=15368 RepID=A0A0Q3HBE2_BRADI|nr:hypothetical protein BRADI_5g27053v3 [Brachypodium distachyon]
MAPPPWDSLPADLLRLVAGRVLATGDLLDYVRFRAACAHWRSSTDSPLGRGILDPRFHPRHWIMLPDGHGLHPPESPTNKKRFFNLSTGAFAHPRLPILSDHHVICPVQGLLLLLHSQQHDDDILLLHPFTGDLMKLPPKTSLRTSLRAHLQLPIVLLSSNFLLSDVVASVTVSTSTSTDDTDDGSSIAAAVVVIKIAFSYSSRLVFFAVRDDQWRVMGSVTSPPNGGLISVQGKFYVVVYPEHGGWLVIVEMEDGDQGKMYPPFDLVECGSQILLTAFEDRARSGPAVVYRVADLAMGGRSVLVPVTDIGGNALLVGLQRSLSLGFKAAPAIAIAGDTVVVSMHPVTSVLTSSVAGGSSASPHLEYIVTSAFNTSTSTHIPVGHFHERPPRVPRLPEPDEHAEHDVLEAEPEGGVCDGHARNPCSAARAAPLAEVEERHSGVLVEWLRGGLKQSERMWQLPMRAERSQHHARVGGERGGRRR